MSNSTKVDQNYAENYRHFFVLYSKVIKFQYLINHAYSTDLPRQQVSAVHVHYSRCQGYDM